MQRILDAIPAAILALEVSNSGVCQCVFMNQSAESLLGLDVYKVIGMQAGHFLKPVAADEFEHKLRLCLASKKPINFEQVFGFAATPRYLNIALAPVSEGDTGRVYRIILSAVDITQQKESERRRNEAESLLQTMFDTTIAGLCMADINRKIIKVNNAFASLLDYTPEQLLGQNFDQLFIDSDRAGLNTEYQRYMQTTETSVSGADPANLRELRLQGADGSVIDVLAGISRFTTAGGEPCAVVSVTDVTKQKQIARELEAARTKALFESNVKSQFLAMMSHELRTPLNAILGFAELINDQVFGAIKPERYGDYVDDITKSARHLLSLIDDLLAMSVLDETPKVEEEVEVEVAQAVRSCLASVRNRADMMQVRLVDDIRANFSVKVNPKHFRQVIMNLLSNAIKFTPPGGVIEVGTRLDGQNLALYVADTGIGIQPDDLQRLMEQPFTQVENQFRRTRAGVGAGLTVARRLAAIHGGDVQIESSFGRGTTASFTIPAERVTANAS